MLFSYSYQPAHDDEAISAAIGAGGKGQYLVTGSDVFFVNNALAILRKSWHIPSGRGSQDWVVSTMETLHQYIGEEIQYLENYDFREDEYHEADFV